MISANEPFFGGAAFTAGAAAAGVGRLAGSFAALAPFDDLAGAEPALTAEL